MNAFTKLPTPTKRRALTPEDAAVIDPEALPGYHGDAIACALARAESMLLMLSCQFDSEDGCELHHSVIGNVLWAIGGEIEMAKKLVLHGMETQDRGRE